MIAGRAVVVHGFDGGRIACALLVPDGCDITSSSFSDPGRFCVGACNAALQTAETECATEDPETSAGATDARGWCEPCGIAYQAMRAPESAGGCSSNPFFFYLSLDARSVQLLLCGNLPGCT